MKQLFPFLMLLLSVAAIGQPDSSAVQPMMSEVDVQMSEVDVQMTDNVSMPVRDYRELLCARLDTLMCDTLLETTQLGLMVWDLTSDSPLYQHNARQLMRPASTMKLLTAITALDRLGGGHHFTTTLYYKGSIVQGQLRGDLFCVGGMDPMFDASDMKALAMAVRVKGITSIRGRLVCDYSMKDTDKWGEGWCWDDKNPTLSSLLVDGSPLFSAALLRELRSVGVSTGGVTTASGKVPSDATALSTRWHTLDDVLQQMMKESDNLFAESVYYQIAASNGHRPAQARDAQKIERELMTQAGLRGDDYRLADGSGLSLYNYLSAEAEVMLLRYAWQRSAVYEHLLPSLPIAGVDGTLKKRMTDDEAACGNVMAKTGTVTGISALAGYLTAPDGHRLAFSIINQGVRRASDGRQFQDRLCHILCSAQ